MGCAWRNEAVLSWRRSKAAVASVVAAEAGTAAAVAFAADAADAADAAAVEHTSHMTELRMLSRFAVDVTRRNTLEVVLTVKQSKQPNRA